MTMTIMTTMMTTMTMWTMTWVTRRSSWHWAPSRRSHGWKLRNYDGEPRCGHRTDDLKTPLTRLEKGPRCPAAEATKLVTIRWSDERVVEGTGHPGY